MYYPKYNQCEGEERPVTYNMRTKINWNIIIGMFVLFFGFLLLALILSYLFTSTTLVFDTNIDVPTINLTVEAVFDDGIRYGKNINIPGGSFYNNSTDARISDYVATLNSSIGGDLNSAVTGNDTVKKNAASASYDSKSRTITITLKDAVAISLYTNNSEYWNDLGFSTVNTLSLFSKESCINNLTNYMTSVTSLPILARVQREE
jgi:hypothetical protein